MKKEPGAIFPHVLKRVLPATFLALFCVWLGLRTLSAGTILKQVHERVGLMADQTARVLSTRISDLLRETRNLAGNDLIINSLIDPDTRENYLPLFFQSLRFRGSPGERISLVDYRGRPVAESRERTPDYPGEDCLRALMEGKSFVNVTGSGLRIAAPVFYCGHPEGAVMLDYGPGELGPLFSVSESGCKAAVFDRDGKPLFASAGVPWGSLRPQNGDNPLPGFIVQSRELPEYHQLTVMCVTPEKEALANLRRVDLYFLLAGVLSLGALAIGVVLSARMVAGPLTDFVERMNAITGLEDLGRKFPDQGCKEIRALAERFNRLLGDLSAATRRLRESEAAAGRAEVYADVLHHVGNAVTPVLLYLEEMRNDPEKRAVDYLEKSWEDLMAHRDDLTAYVTRHERGQRIFQFIYECIGSLKKEAENRQTVLLRMKSSVSEIVGMLKTHQSRLDATREVNKNGE